MGQAINIPWDWAAQLKLAGYDVRQDPGAGPGVTPVGLPHIGPIPIPQPPQNFPNVFATSGEISARSANRPRGGFYVEMRHFVPRPVAPGPDQILPAKLARIGSNTDSMQQLTHLAAMNPHLISPRGILEGFRPGDQINIPADWAHRLRERGFLVKHD
jgi:hypothetical protein